MRITFYRSNYNFLKRFIHIFQNVEIFTWHEFNIKIMYWFSLSICNCVRKINGNRFSFEYIMKQNALKPSAALYFVWIMINYQNIFLVFISKSWNFRNLIKTALHRFCCLFLPVMFDVLIWHQSKCWRFRAAISISFSFEAVMYFCLCKVRYSTNSKLMKYSLLVMHSRFAFG